MFICGLIQVIQTIQRKSRMEKLIVTVLNIIAKHEFELENIRQLLGEQVEFTVQKAYKHIVCCSFTDHIDLYSLLNFLGGERNTPALQSVLKYYSNNELRISLKDFESISLAREDKLIKKLTKQRENSEDREFPQYLINYCKKLWYIEEELHEELNKIKVSVKNGTISKLKIFNNKGYLDQDPLKTIFLKQQHHQCHECPQIKFGMAIRYLSKGQSQSNQGIPFQVFSSLFVPQNCNTITNYLSLQDQTYKRSNSKPKKQKNPYLHQEFQKMKIPSTTVDPHFCFREIKSVQDHIKRAKNLETSTNLKKNIKGYSSVVSNYLLCFYTKIKKIIKKTFAVNELKETLLRHYKDANFSGLFVEIATTNTLVPSQLQHYLRGIGVQVKLNDLFVLFKKYGDPIDGKMNHFYFKKIFFLNRSDYSSTEKDEVVHPNFRVEALTCILKEIDHELKIDKLRQELSDEVHLRDLFDSFLPDQKGRISRTDIQVAIKRGTGFIISDNQLQILWGRMGKKKEEYINYDIFMAEMIPKTKKRVFISKKTQPSFRI